MAILKIVTKEYRNSDAINKLIAYALNREKMPNNIWGGSGISFDFPAESMNIIKRVYGQTTGKQAQHFILAFDKREECRLCASLIQLIACEICNFFKNTQVFYAVHENRSTYIPGDCDDGYIHVHFIVNTVDIESGKKFRIDFSNEPALRKHIEKVLLNRGVSKFVQLVTRSTDGWPVE